MHLAGSRLVVPIILLALGSVLYLPGLNGPYLFDDYSNLLDNQYLRLKSLDVSSFWQASFSQNAGPLQRPVAMATFALNNYFAGGFESRVPYHATNIAIHFLNGVLVYFLLRLLIEHHVTNRSSSARSSRSWLSSEALASALALLWLVHPINLTGVLYVVQRMTSLAAFFMLLALLCYLHARLRILAKRSDGTWRMFGGVVLFGILGALSKENALLLPLFVLLLELTLFPHDKLWARWRALSPRTKVLLLSSVAAIGLIILFAAIEYALPTYARRTFTMTERVFTETRVVLMYLLLIVFPRLDAFGMFHDDISLSRSLLDPPTTLFASLILIGLMAIAFASRRRRPLVTLGIAWFFAAHLLESTIFSLEIAYEHRNYFASIGLPIVLLGLLPLRSNKKGARLWLGAVFAMICACAVVTFLRASQWTDEETLYSNEARHHPESARAVAGLGRTLINQGRVGEGMASLRRAAELEPHEAATLINITVFGSIHGVRPDPSDLATIEQRLANNPATATTERALLVASDCVIAACSAVAPYFEKWVRILLSNENLAPFYASSYYQFLGRALAAQGERDEAVDAYRMAYDLDPQYLVPLFDIAQIYLAAGRLDYAQVIAAEIRRANERVRLPRRTELRDLEQVIEEAHDAQVRKPR